MVHQVNSSAIDWIDFIPSKNSAGTAMPYGVLSVHHKGKSWVYHYAKVPKEVYEAFKVAPSAGSFFATEIKDRYEFRKEEL